MVYKNAALAVTIVVGMEKYLVYDTVLPEMVKGRSFRNFSLKCIYHVFGCLSYTGVKTACLEVETATQEICVLYTCTCLLYMYLANSRCCFCCLYVDPSTVHGSFMATG